MQEWLNWHAWKACNRLKRFRGSNPLLSAKGRRATGESRVALFLLGIKSSMIERFISNNRLYISMIFKTFTMQIK